MHGSRRLTDASLRCSSSTCCSRQPGLPSPVSCDKHRRRERSYSLPQPYATRDFAARSCLASARTALSVSSSSSACAVAFCSTRRPALLDGLLLDALACPRVDMHPRARVPLRVCRAVWIQYRVFVLSHASPGLLNSTAERPDEPRRGRSHPTRHPRSLGRERESCGTVCHFEFATRSAVWPSRFPRARSDGARWLRGTSHPRRP